MYIYSMYSVYCTVYSNILAIYTKNGHYIKPHYGLSLYI